MFNMLKHTAITDRLLRRPPFLHARCLRQIRMANDMSMADRKSHNTNLLYKVLERARTLPGYALAPASNKLEDWPLLTKQELLGREHLFATPRSLPAPKAETGGTTGQPLRMIRTVENIVREQALIDYLCETRGIDVRKARVAVLRGDAITGLDINASRYWTDEGTQKRIYSAHHISPDTIAHYVRSLRSYKPDVLLCYPSSLAALTAGIEPLDGLRIPLVFSSSEVLSAELIASSRIRLGCDIIDFYGHAERIVTASAINGHDYFFQPGYGHVELLPCGDGRARIVATSLDWRGQIFVRYETGDIAITETNDPAVLEQIAYGCLPFCGIEGRESEYVELSDKRRIIGLNHIPRGVVGAATVQLHASGTDCVDIYVVPANGFSQSTSQHILENFYVKFPRTVEARLWRVQTPVRQANGKAPLLLRNPVLPDHRTLVFKAAPASQAA